MTLSRTRLFTIIAASASFALAASAQVAPAETAVAADSAAFRTVPDGTSVLDTASAAGTSNTSRAARFGALKISRDSTGTALFEVTVHHDGNRSSRPTLSIALYDSRGALAARVSHVRGQLSPRGSLRQRFELGALPPGVYTAIVAADTGDPVRYAAQYTVTFN